MAPIDRSGRIDPHRKDGTTRRHFLAALAAAGATGMAGCQGGDGGAGTSTGTPTPSPTPGLEGFETDTPTPDETDEDTPTETSTPEPTRFVEGQEFRDTLWLNPAQVTFFWENWNAGTFDTKFHASGGGYPGYIAWAMRPPAKWGRWMNGLYAWTIGGEDFDGIYDEFEITNDKLEAKVRDDANWSDGEPVTAFDATATTLSNRFSPLVDHSQFIPADDADPNKIDYPNHFTGLEFPDGKDGKRFKWTMKTDALTRGSEYIWRFFYGSGRGGGPEFPTHVEPLNSFYNALLDAFRKGERGELQDGVPSIAEFYEEYIPESIFKEWRKPENVITCGAWTLDQIKGEQAVVLKPNEHAPEDWQPNFGTYAFEHMQEEERFKSAAMADKLDVFSQDMRPDLVKNLPDSFEERKVPSGGGNGLGVSHDHELFQHREVRAALMYAMDKEAIAGNIHPTNTRHITTPAGDLWGRKNAVSDDWVNNTLIDYSQDLDRANALMEEAGFSKEGGNWVNGNGDAFSFILPTTSDSPRFETTLSKQLSDFGLETQVQSFDNATYWDKWDAGEFSIWPDNRWSTGFFRSPFDEWWIGNSDALTTYGFFPEEQEKEAFKDYADNGWVLGNWSAWEPLTLQMAPVGKPDAAESDYVDFKPMYLRGRETTLSGSEEDLELWKKFYWLANWHLPALPIANRVNQWFIDSTHWNWPKDHPTWDYAGQGWFNAAQYNGMGMIAANDDNPEEGASVREE